MNKEILHGNCGSCQPEQHAALKLREEDTWKEFNTIALYSLHPCLEEWKCSQISGNLGLD